jgi:8-oxo-dGTP pyrophosphatase MutT (NUDIX family)
VTTRDSFVDELRDYIASDDREERMRQRMLAFVEAQPDAFERACAIGHITASAWIVDRDRSRALLTHHRKLGKWLQLGGHTDGDSDVRAAALREAREESGLTSLRFASPSIYDLDIHRIPARGPEPEHEHFDVRFALEADATEPFVVSDESHDLAWIALDALSRYGADESVLRLARKTAALGTARL